MKQRILLAASLMFLCSALPAQAGDMQDAVLVRISSSKAWGDIVFIKTDKSKASFPGCQTNLSWDYVMPLVSEQDNKLFAMLLAARASQTPITLRGAGACSHFASIETAIEIVW